MGTKNGLPIYEPPMARDLSGGGVSGQGPLAFCHNGSLPGDCAGGSGPAGGCTNGNRFGELCGGGGNVTTIACSTGSRPA